MAAAVDVQSPLHDINNNNNNGGPSIIRRSPSASSVSSTSTDVDDSSDMDPSSEDDEKGVFFGGHDAREAQLVAKLSSSLSASPNSPTQPLQQSPQSPHHRRQSRPRVKKRDSREFLRRRTLLVSARANATPEKQQSDHHKVWEGGFFEKKTQRPAEQDSECEYSTPNLFKCRMSQAPSHTLDAEYSNVTADCSKFHLSDVVPASATKGSEHDSQEEDEYLSESELGESDKENDAAAASPSIRRRPSAVLSPLVVVGMESGNSTDSEDMRGIDLGGLALTDFADPHSSFEEKEVQSEDIDLGGESDDASRGPFSPDHQEAVAVAAIVEEEIEKVEALEDGGGFEEAPEEEGIEGESLGEDGMEEGCMQEVNVDAVDLEDDVDEKDDLLHHSMDRETIAESCQDVKVDQQQVVATAEVDVDFPNKDDEAQGAVPSLEDGQPVSEEDAFGPQTEAHVKDCDSEKADEPSPFAAISTPLSKAIIDAKKVDATDYSLLTPNAPIAPEADDKDDDDALQDDSILGSDDSPLPVARAGPVVIPPIASHLAFSMRAETGSPYRSLPSPTETILQTDADATVRLASVDSPTPPSSSSAATPLAQKIPSTLPPNEVASELPQSKAAKSVASSLAATASVDRPKRLASSSAATATAAANNPLSSRAFAIRGQLDAAFVGRLGPPQRTASTSSGSSTSSRPGSGLSCRPPASGPPRPRPQVTTARPFNLSSSSRTARPAGAALAKPAPAKTVPGQSKPMALPPKTVLGLSRSTQSQAPHPIRVPLDVRHAPPVFEQPVPVSRPVRVPSTLSGSVRKPALSMSVQREKQVTPPLQSSVPVKRPLSASVGHGSTLARSLTSVSVGPSASRPALGLPARLVRGGQPGAAPVFSLGVGGGGGIMSEAVYGNRPVFESPRAKRPYGTPLTVKKNLGTPARGISTPSRNGRLATPKAGQPVATPLRLCKPTNIFTPVSAKKAASGSVPLRSVESEQGEQATWSSEDGRDVATLLSCSSPPAEALRPATRSQSASPTKPIVTESPSPANEPGLEADAAAVAEEKEEEEEDTGNEGKEEESSRPKRAIRPPQRLAKTATASSNSSASSVPGMSEKELKAATQRNTSRNEVYHCAIDRQIVRVNAPRPPSPTSRIRTTADREEEERRASREMRAKRRSRETGDGGEQGQGDDSDPECPPLVERVERARGPGEDEDYVTPARPLPSKKTKVRHGNEKNVRWDRGLTVIRNDGRSVERPRLTTHAAPFSGVQGLQIKSALKGNNGGVQLDRHGNVVEGTRPKETLKRQRVVVTAVFYEGEEPVPLPPAPSSTCSGKGKKK